MTTVEQATGRSLLDGALNAPMTVPGRRRVRGWLVRYGQRVRNVTVMLVATGCGTAAAYTWHVWASLVATGAAVLLVDFAADERAPKGPAA